MKCVILQWYIAWWCLGNLLLKSAQPMWVFYSLRKYIFLCILWICKIYIILWIRTDHKMNYMFWIIWIVWLCLIISMMFKNWCMSEIFWIDLKCLSVCCSWDLNYANCLRTCHVETVYILWSKYDLNDFKVFDEMLNCLVLRWHDLAKAWFYSMIQ
jgi:hypothetical protein